LKAVSRHSDFFQPSQEEYQGVRPSARRLFVQVAFYADCQGMCLESDLSTSQLQKLPKETILQKLFK
jgi:hypothetical protein